MLDPGSPEHLERPNGEVTNDHTARPLMPPFSDIAKATIESLGVVSDEFSSLAEVTQTHPIPERQHISQQTIDILASKIFGESGLKSAKQMASTFDELSQKFSRGESGRPHSQLQGSAAKLVFGNSGRSVSRRAWGPNSSKGSRLIKYLSGVDMPAGLETLDGIRKQIIRPVLDRVKNSTKPEEIGTYTLQEIQGLLSEINEVDVNANLNTLKLITFMTMADCLKNPELLKALYRKLGQPETERELLSSQYTGFYEAANLADQLRSDDIDVRRGTVSYLRAGNPYKRTKLLQFRESKESRAYNEECDRLEEACFTYVDLVNTQKWLQRIKARGEKFETMKEQGAVIIAGRIAVRASGFVSQSNEELSDARDTMISQSNGDKEATEQAWKNAISAEDLIIASARGLLTHVTSLRLKMSQDAKDLLRGTLKQSIRDEYDIIKRQASDEKLRPEINRLKSEFDEIDKLYHLPGKKLRDRDPDLIPLARYLSDILSKLSPEHEPLDQYTARDLAGLLKGVYWERTGKGSSTPEIIQRYLDDAKTLRTLSGQLEKLGINTSSKLLQSINLLDEMIDSGAFDDINEHPEYEELTNFIFSYMSLRDGNKVIPDELEHVQVKEPSKEKPLSPLPIEIVGQADELDILVFPPGSSAREVVSEFSQHIENGDLYTVQWERIIKLVELRDHCEKQGLGINFMRTKQASWQKLPFFVLEVTIPGDNKSIAIVESPVYGNATYMFKESSEQLNWRDVIQLTRQEARELGAVPAVHVDDKKLEDHKKKLWDRIISELATF